ncbi:hypothetical protein Tco_0265900 [Tanacetum coccineum]
MTKVIKEEFEKLESLKIGDDSFACNTSLEIFHKEFNRMRRMDEDLFTYEVEILGLASVPCNLNNEGDSERLMTHGSDVEIEYDPSNVGFIEWLASKFYNHKTMDPYTKNALWIYWTRGDDEVELTDEESSDSDNEDEVTKIFRIDTNVFDFETPTCKAFKEFNYLLQIDLDFLTRILTDLKPTKNIRMTGYMSGIKIYRGGHMEWPTSLKDSKLKKEALKNKAIMEGIIDEDDESSNEGWRRWDNFENTNRDHEERKYEMEHEDEERCELFDDNPHQEAPVCNIRRFDMIKYSFGKDEEYVAIKECEYDDEDARHTYQEIFRRMDEGWMVARAE